MRFTLALSAALLAASPALADRLPEGAIPITEALGIAEADGLTAINGADFDDGRWNVEGIGADSRELEIEIDAMTGEIVDRDG